MNTKPSNDVAIDATSADELPDQPRTWIDELVDYVRHDTNVLTSLPAFIRGNAGIVGHVEPGELIKRLGIQCAEIDASVDLDVGFEIALPSRNRVCVFRGAGDTDAAVADLFAIGAMMLILEQRRPSLYRIVERSTDARTAIGCLLLARCCHGVPS